MPFHRFEQFERRLLTPHLSRGSARVERTANQRASGN
jgi:hypothetical protein